MTSPQRNNLFLSQAIQISHRSTSPPLLIAPNMDSQQFRNRDIRQEKPTEEPVAWHAWKIQANSIPSLNIYYRLERTSITLKKTPIALVESRMRNFFRLQSIAYEFDAVTVSFHCVTDGMLKFVVQLWRVFAGPDKTYFEDPNEALTVELQRRQGSTIEMENIRRKMFQALSTGEQKAPERKPRQPPLPDTIMMEVSSGYDQDEGLADAIEIALRLLESQCIDQSRLGLESLAMLTDASIVSPQDALVVSKGIVLREGRFGARLQTSLMRFFGVAKQTNVEAEDTMGHGMALSILTEALQVVTEDAAKNNHSRSHINAMDISLFWRRVSEDLFHNVETAIQKPHDAAKSAKCIRHLFLNNFGGTTLGEAAQVPLVKASGWRSCLAQAHEYGQHFHLSLERESQMLLAMDTENFVRAH